MVKIAVLLTCFNRRDKTLQCLGNLYGQERRGILFELDVFLVDDASTDGTSQAVSERFPEVNIIKGNGKLYWNRGMYTAWKNAASDIYDYYLWLNDDTDLLPGAITEMLQCDMADSVPAIVCGAICSANTKMFSYGGVSKDGRAVVPDGTVQHCYIINGNCVLVSKAAFQLAGNIDPVFPHAIGDHDYGLRLLKAGGKIITTRKFIGYCERNAKLPKWCYSETPLKERVKALYSPLGNSHPKYYFIYERRHFGLFLAVKHYLSIHLRVLIPSLWK
ncbi:GT2 family glycosyltransferase [Filimonas zeae]|uniref:Acetylglucosaminyltransferase n=1 Tax=Filimonas zeae TaxID=1737353 RepID=A0A917MPJ2_9BACT|nr:glycosyltransferase family 2 protein [Filimonas zeae]MDR6337000.1 GT2 family glycosyltransferase [Filimonas zeae]GGH56526.1 acetylglucosaminyltransferase [Filimonas zeae]